MKSKKPYNHLTCLKVNNLIFERNSSMKNLYLYENLRLKCEKYTMHAYIFSHIDYILVVNYEITEMTTYAKIVYLID